LFERFAADAPRGRLFASEPRKLYLEIEQLAVKLVIFPIANGGSRFLIVAAIVLLDLAPERLDLGTHVVVFCHRLTIQTRGAPAMSWNL